MSYSIIINEEAEEELKAAFIRMSRLM